jgi:hypothetical protein
MRKSSMRKAGLLHGYSRVGCVCALDGALWTAPLDGGGRQSGRSRSCSLIRQIALGMQRKNAAGRKDGDDDSEFHEAPREAQQKGRMRRTATRPALIHGRGG